jgi:hypothetical protein
VFLQLEAILESQLTFPALECFHIAGLAIGIGSIAIVDFRLLGLGLKQSPVAALAARLTPWTLLGLFLVFFSAAGLFYSDPDLYYLNPSFQLKMLLLFAALVFHFVFRQPRVLSGPPEGSARWLGASSLLLWTAIVFCGIFIAFTGEAD